MPAPIDDYLARLRQELQRHGCEDARLIEEAREHLTDDIDEGVRRGLTPRARRGPPIRRSRQVAGLGQGRVLLRSVPG